MNRLEELLKKKGIGPEGSKSLKKEELNELRTLFHDSGISMTTKATILTALLTLERTEAEESWLKESLISSETFFPVELLPFVSNNTKIDRFTELIKKVIAHIDLTEEECQEGMNLLFTPSVPEHLKGPFLEAERLKRESFIENKAFFNFLWNRSERKQLEIPVLIDIGDSYDGSGRSKNFAVFTAALLASCGYPTLVHGVESVAPKFGITSHQILKAAGKNPLKELNEVVDYLSNPAIGWGYLDQKISFPELYALREMRKEMVKRPFLATFEKLLQPIRAKTGNYIVTGYTHPHYKEELIKQLADQKACTQAIVLKGVEGSTHMSLSKDTVCVHYNGSVSKDDPINPARYGLLPLEAKIDKNLTAEDSYEEGLAALQGVDNYARENILYLAMVILTTFGLGDEKENLKMLKKNLSDQSALRRFSMVD